MSTTELDVGPSSLTQTDPTHSESDPTQLNPSKIVSIDPTRPDPTHQKNKQESPAVVADKPARRFKSGSRVTQGHRKWHHSI